MENRGAISRITRIVEAITMLLAVQFLLGMYLNLFWTGVGAFGEVILAAHIGIAIVMVSAAGLSLYLSFSIKAERKIIVMMALILANLIIAGFMGLIFLNYGNSNIASFLMATFFLIAYGFVGYAAAALRREQN